MANRTDRLQGFQISLIEWDSSGVGPTYVILYGSINVLLDTFSVEDMSTFCLNGIFGDFITNAANGDFASVIWEKGAGIRLASKDQVRVTSHLTHPSESNELVSTTKERSCTITPYKLKILE